MTSREIRLFDVTFKEASGQYRPGDVVHGTVLLDIGAPLKMKGVKLHLQGVSRVSWDEKRSYTKGSGGNVPHKDVEVHLDEQVMILNSVAGNVMGQGRYNWPFTVRLPKYLPASFEGAYGKVWYWAKVSIDQPWKKDTEVQKIFTVIGTLDLNTEPDTHRAVEGIGEVMAGSLCCKSGPITAKVTLPLRGYVGNQNIAFKVQIDNESKSPLRNISMGLYQQVTFKADKRTKRQMHLLKGISWRDVNPGENTQWEDELKNIPNTVPSRLGCGCKQIDVKYLVQFYGKPGSRGSLEAPAEIIMGTVALRQERDTTLGVPGADGRRGRSHSRDVRTPTRELQELQLK